MIQSERKYDNVLSRHLTNKYVNRNLERYYMESSEFAFPRVSDAITHLAKLESKYYHKGDDVYIPVDIISLLSSRYGANHIVPLDILYVIYLEQYLLSIGASSKNKA